MFCVRCWECRYKSILDFVFGELGREILMLIMDKRYNEVFGIREGRRKVFAGVEGSGIRRDFEEVIGCY